MRIATRAHPARLAWYAGGQLASAEAAEIARHLESCPECRVEVEALRSVYGGMRRSLAFKHPSAERLVAYHGGTLAGPDADSRAIESHLGVCHACAEDVRALDRAESASRRRRVHPLWGVAASVLIAVAAGWYVADRSATATIVFPPAVRGEATAIVFPGAGPWPVEVWPPLGGGQEYVVRVQRSDDPAAAGFELPVTASPKDGAVRLRIPRGRLRPGHHELSLTPQGGDAPVYVRGFEVEDRRP